jgi:hypothetical protein
VEEDLGEGATVVEEDLGGGTSEGDRGPDRGSHTAEISSPVAGGRTEARGWLQRDRSRRTHLWHSHG